MPSWILAASGTAKRLCAARARIETAWKERPMLYSALVFDSDA
jgi:hypothetical protein